MLTQQQDAAGTTGNVTSKLNAGRTHCGCSILCFAFAMRRLAPFMDDLMELGAALSPAAAILWLLPCSWLNTSHGSSPAVDGLVPDVVLACDTGTWLLSALMSADESPAVKTFAWMLSRDTPALRTALHWSSDSVPLLPAGASEGTGLRVCLAALPAGRSKTTGDCRPEPGPPAKLSLRSKSLPRAARSRISSRCCSLQSTQSDSDPNLAASATAATRQPGRPALHFKLDQ